MNRRYPMMALHLVLLVGCASSECGLGNGCAGSAALHSRDAGVTLTSADVPSSGSAASGSDVHSAESVPPDMNQRDMAGAPAPAPTAIPTTTPLAVPVPVPVPYPYPVPTPTTTAHASATVAPAHPAVPAAQPSHAPHPAAAAPGALTPPPFSSPTPAAADAAAPITLEDWMTRGVQLAPRGYVASDAGAGPFRP